MDTLQAADAIIAELHSTFFSDLAESKVAVVLCSNLTSHCFICLSVCM